MVEFRIFVKVIGDTEGGWGLLTGERGWGGKEVGGIERGIEDCYGELMKVGEDLEGKGLEGER